MFHFSERGVSSTNTGWNGAKQVWTDFLWCNTVEEAVACSLIIPLNLNPSEDKFGFTVHTVLRCTLWWGSLTRCCAAPCEGGCHMAPSQSTAEEEQMKVIDCVWLHYASPPPQTSSRRGSKAMWTCSLPCGVWVTCTQEGAVIYHHPLDQIGWLTTGVKSTAGWVSACSALLTPDCLSVCTVKTNGDNIQHMCEWLIMWVRLCALQATWLCCFSLKWLHLLQLFQKEIAKNEQPVCFNVQKLQVRLLKKIASLNIS